MDNAVVKYSLVVLMMVVACVTGEVVGRRPVDVARSFVEAFRSGAEAYGAGRWSDCITHMEEVVLLFKRHRTRVVHCRDKCHRQAAAQQGLLVVGDLRFYERAIRDTLCLMQCRQEDGARFLERTEDTKEALQVEADILQQKPYDYLQLCYYKVNDLPRAIASAYTFLVHHPGHEVMQSNLRFYTTQPGAEEHHARNLETQPHQELYLAGNRAYIQKDYHKVVSIFEEALVHYYRAEEECRLLCEGHFDKGPMLDLTMSIANHFTHSLRCKQRCPHKLALVYGEQREDYLPSHYHYLQYAYYQIGEIEKTCEAVASHLHFHPNNEVMLHNKEFYSRRLKSGTSPEEYFVPRQEVTEYVARDTDEKLLLAFIESYFPGEKSTAGAIGPGQSANGKETSVNGKPVTVVMAERELRGKNRFVVDGVVDSDECQQLLQLATQGAVNGDGYNGKMSPHTKFETFEGLTIGRAAVLVSMGLLDTHLVQLLLDVSERGRSFSENHFLVDKDHMHFSYTHLVCRTARPDSPANRSDLSHPVHADNCIVKKDGSCVKERPAYTWRDYSAIIYLNDDFDGGEFIFAENKDKIQASVRPKCGRMVGFSAGMENTHGVRAVLRGRRCAVAMWFTLDQKHREKERFLAVQVLVNQHDKTNSRRQHVNRENEQNHLHAINKCNSYHHLVNNAYKLGRSQGFEGNGDETCNVHTT